MNKLIGKYVMWWEIYPDGASLNERGTVIADLGSGFLLAAIDDNEHGMRKVISLAANNGNSGLVIFDDKTAAQAWLASLEDDDDKRIRASAELIGSGCGQGSPAGKSGAFSLCILPHADRLHCAGKLM